MDRGGTLSAWWGYGSHTVRDGERWNVECLVGLGFSHSKRWREVER